PTNSSVSCLSSRGVLSAEVPDRSRFLSLLTAVCPSSHSEEQARKKRGKARERRGRCEEKRGKARKRSGLRQSGDLEPVQQDGELLRLHAQDPAEIPIILTRRFRLPRLPELELARGLVSGRLPNLLARDFPACRHVKVLDKGVHHFPLLRGTFLRHLVRTRSTLRFDDPQKFRLKLTPLLRAAKNPLYLRGERSVEMAVHF